MVIAVAGTLCALEALNLLGCFSAEFHLVSCPLVTSYVYIYFFISLIKHLRGNFSSSFNFQPSCLTVL